jgi:hypothetical protein
MMSLIADGFRRAISAAENGNPDFFVTFESRTDPDKWIQLTWSNVNAAYPLRVEPDKELRRRGFVYPENVELASWEAGKFATFEHGAEPLADLVAFVERYAREILGVEPDDSALTVVTE